MPATKLRRLAGERAAAVSFAVIEVASIPLLLFFGRRWWFWADDWDFLGGRTAGNLGDLFRSHYQHWTTLPILAYRILWTLFGLRSYVPYQLLVIGAHLVAVALLRIVMRRAGVRPWLATLVALVFLFFGSGAENILIAFQVTFVGSLVFGLTQLLLADHEGPIDRRDWLGLLAGFAGLMCSGVAVAMTVIVGVAVLLRRGWRVALLHTVPLATAYVLWLALSPKAHGASVYRSQSPLQVLHFIWIGVQSAFARLGQVPGLGILLALLLIAGAVLIGRTRGDHGLRGRLAVPVALLVGAVVFLVVTGLVRSGQPASIAGAINVGPGRARQSRYVYLVAAMALPAIALAADAVIARWRALTIPVLAVLVAGVPGNIHQLSTYTKLDSIDRAQFKTEVLEAPRLPVAGQLPPKIPPVPPPANFSGLTMGWLVASLPSGRIPSPGHLSTTQIADQTVHLVLLPVPRKFRDVNSCRTLHGPETIMLDRADRVTVKSGLATITYFPPTGGASSAELFSATTFASRVDSVRLQIAPAGTTPPVVCRLHA